MRNDVGWCGINVEWCGNDVEQMLNKCQMNVEWM